MQLAKVLGQVVSTAKRPELEGFTLLLVQDASEADTEQMQGSAYVAVDVIGAGVGELVLVTTGGAARIAAGNHIPTDRAVIAIADTVVRAGVVSYTTS